MKVYQTNELKNVVLLGGAKSGKTTLSESMLFVGKVISRKGSVDDKNSVSDYRDIELERQNSVYASQLYTEYGGKKINFFDTPGFTDYIGEVISSLYVADLGVMVVNAQTGVEVGTEVTWRRAKEMDKGIIFVINQLDHEKAKFDDIVNQLKENFGDKVVLAQYPVNAGEGFDTFIDVITMKQYKQSGEKVEVTDIPDAEKEKAESLRQNLMDFAAESDEALMEKYFENDTLSEKEFQEGLQTGLKGRDLFPVLCTSAKNDVGTERLLEFINNCAPSPTDFTIKTDEGKELSCKKDDVSAIFVFKTSMEQHLGELSYFKVLGGEITEGLDLSNATSSSKERISQMLVTAGKNKQKVDKLVAGDIGAAIKLKSTKTNDTLSALKSSVGKVHAIVFPEPLYTTAIKAVNSSDDEKLGSILNEMQKTDPTLISYFSTELKQMILQGQGELHINTAKWHLDNIHKIDTAFFAPKTPYRETITKNAKSMYRHKKQSGGAGQFGEVYMLVHPFSKDFQMQTEYSIRKTDEVELKWGGKLILNNCIVGGAIDTRFIPAIMKGLMERMEEGPLTGSYARDIVVNVYDGKMHPVDSNEISFKLAARYAFSEAFKNAGPKIMEPVYDVEIMVPEDRMGDVITDLNGRRAIIMGMEGAGKLQRIKAKVPLAEMNRYSTSLSSITSGRATFSVKFDAYQQVPSDVQVQLLKTYEADQEEED